MVKKKSVGTSNKKAKQNVQKKSPVRLSTTDQTSRVLFAASEVYPLIKTGGLADVACFLPLALHELGYDIRIVLPAYQAVLASVQDVKAHSSKLIPGTDIRFRLLETTLPDSDVPVYLVDIPALYDRPGSPYQAKDGKDWVDNAERFGLFGRVIKLISLNQAGLNWSPALLHCNDWHTGLAAALLAQESDRPAIIFGIHNLAYQGIFPYSMFGSLKLAEKFRSSDSLEFYGNLSFIKGGLVYADKLITVSPAYAKEIMTPAYGHDLDGLLRHRSESLSGILNGVDYRFWDPRYDPMIEHHYWLNDLHGKKTNKRSLQQQVGLLEDDNAILLAHVSRLSEQKGIDLILDGLAELLQEKQVQFVVLGTGDARYEQLLQAAADNFAGQMAVVLDYNEVLAHRIQASADIFLMPSRYEPCGLTQLYALRYGTIPIVRKTGGLADTVVDTSEATLRNQTATGFQFRDATTRDFIDATQRAITMCRSCRSYWKQIMRTAMQQEFSWETSARLYAGEYTDVISMNFAKNNRSF